MSLEIDNIVFRQTEWHQTGVSQLRGLLLPARGDDEERDPESGIKITSVIQSEASICM